MKVGIIVHSHTGNTLSVAEKIREELIKSGHTVNLEQVKAVDENPNSSKPVELEVIPDTTGYDALIFGAPVRAFSLSPVMKKYLSQVNSLEGKKVCCFVTQGFPKPWMGGNHSVKQMVKLCSAKNCKPSKTGIVNWPEKSREVLTANLVTSFTGI